MSPRVARNRRRAALALILLVVAGFGVLSVLTARGGGIPDSIYMVAFLGCILTAALQADAARWRRHRRIQSLHRQLEQRARRQDPEAFRRWEEGRRGHGTE